MRGLAVRAFTAVRPSVRAGGVHRPVIVRPYAVAAPRPRVILGIESSCDDTGVGIVDSRGRVLGQSLASQAAIHAQWGGVVPMLAREAHQAAIQTCIQQALDQAGMTPADLDAIACTVGPGLSLCLRVGATAARELAASAQLPLIPVHHMEAHALVARLEHPGVAMPFLCVLLSGGHNLLVLVDGVGSYTMLGTTLDDAVGEAFDKTARVIGLTPVPSGGAAVESAAARGNPTAFPFSVPLARQPNCNFSFAGLKTAVLMAAQRALPPEGSPDRAQVQADLAASFQHVTVRHLATRVRRALDWARASRPELRHLVASGGVASNSAIRAALATAAADAGVEFVAPAPALCTDNGIMVAWAGQEMVAAGAADLDAPPPPPLQPEEWVEVKPRWPLTADRHPLMAEEAARSAKKERIFPSLTHIMAARRDAAGKP